MPAASQNTPYPALYRSCMKEAARGGRTLMERLVARCIKSMPRRATLATDVRERNLLTESARILMKHQDALCEAYPQALLAEFAQAIAGAKGRAAALSFDSLELMGEEQVQEGVELVRTQQAVQQAVEAELTELNALICAVQGLRNVQPERNPLRPELYVRSLRTVTLQSPVPPAVRIRWMHHLGEALGPELARVYQELSQLLRSQGVVPAGYNVILAPENPSIAGRSAARAAITGGNQASTLLTVRELRRLLSGELDGSRESFAARFEREFESGARPVRPTEFAVTVPAAFEALQEMKQVDQVMQRLQQRAADPAAPTTGLAALREQLRHEARRPGQALGLEVVNLMVENIASDARLLPPVQQAVRDLEPALLRLALHDPRFFSDKAHPARRLLEQMTQRSLAWPSVDATGFDAFFDPLQQAVDALLATRVSGAEPFDFALTALETAWGEQKERDQRYRERGVRALLKAEQRNLLAEKIGRQLRARPDVEAAPREMIHFVTGPWSHVIAQARQTDEAGGTDPGGYTALLSDLLWSTQPRLAATDPARLARMVPRLVEKLRQGLARIDYPAGQTQGFLDYLVGIHQLAFNPMVEPDRPVFAALSREALESQFADEADAGRSWLAPHEAQESGFMETHPSAARAPLFQATEVGFSAAPADAMEAIPRLGEGGLQPGAWVEMQTDGRWQRLHLTWASPHGTLFMFSDATGKSHSMTRRLLDQLVAAQGLRLISEQAVVDGALDAVAHTALSNSLG
jgi:hypothetical protein